MNRLGGSMQIIPKSAFPFTHKHVQARGVSNSLMHFLMMSIAFQYAAVLTSVDCGWQNLQACLTSALASLCW